MNKTIFITPWIIIHLLFLQSTTYAQNEIKRYDIIIHEIMADPSPTIGLPAAEYIELYNRTSHTQSLHNWKLQLGNTIKKLPDITLESNGYVIIIAEKHLDQFAAICSNICSLSSLSITDAGQTITLLNENEQVIHSVSFKKNWHSESIKRDGGWSLEMIDADLPCIGFGNWNSSVDVTGGTPGAPNSIAQSVGDYTPPEIERITMKDSLTIRIFFTETVLPTLPFDTGTIRLEPFIPIQEVTEVAPDFVALDIHLERPFDNGKYYTVNINGSLCDCAQNCIMKGAGISVGTPMLPKNGDLIINEILTHPKDGTDAEFVEIYNRSRHIIDLNEIKLGYGGDTLPDKAIVACGSGCQIFPNQYCCLCKNKLLTTEQYYCQDKHVLIACDSLPSFNNNNGIIFLTDFALRQIDRFAYDKSMHHSGLSSTDGVSLERLSPDRPTQDAGNWHSAASTVGFATPGYPNSQSGFGESNDQISITPEVFSPDNDGYNDFAEIRISTNEPEQRINIQIFNANGQTVKHLVSNELCGAENVFRWDGQDDNGNILPSGMYLVIVQIWGTDAKTHKLKRVVSIRR